MSRVLLVTLLLSVAIVLAACDRRQAEPQPAAGEVNISFRTEPDPPRAPGEAALQVEVTDNEGRAVSDAEVRVAMVMPMGEMGDMREVAELRWDGQRYSGAINLPMAGAWNVQVEVTRAGEPLGSHETTIEAVQG